MRRLIVIFLMVFFTFSVQAESQLDGLMTMCKKASDRAYLQCQTALYDSKNNDLTQRLSNFDNSRNSCVSHIASINSEQATTDVQIAILSCYKRQKKCRQSCSGSLAFVSRQPESANKTRAEKYIRQVISDSCNRNIKKLVDQAAHSSKGLLDMAYSLLNVAGDRSSLSATRCEGFSEAKNQLEVSRNKLRQYENLLNGNR